MTSSKPLLSRVADSVYWMARYIERAENVARFIGVNLHLMLDLPSGLNQWQPLVDTSGDAQIFKDRYGVATQENVIRFLAFDPQNSNSILSCVRGARENARSVRETISSEMWEEINSMYLLINQATGELAPESLPELFNGVRMASHLFQGITDSTMSHNEAWHFIRLGRHLERADKTSRILDVKYFILLPSVDYVGTPYDDIQWSAVLKSVSGFEMYRKRFGRIVPDRVVEFLLLDREFPRTILYSVRRADQSLHAITGTPMGAFSCVSEQQLGRLRAEIEFANVESILAGGLHEFVDSLQSRVNATDACLVEDFFAQSVPAAAGVKSAAEKS
jgi:uncharacterized alpha-E superfamily protein